MTKTTLNFFGEEVKIDTPKDISSLREKISEKYLLSNSDVVEIILYYIKENKKIYIINGNDFSKFIDSKVSTIFLDVNQNSRLYIENATQLDKEKEKNQKELEELNHKFKHFSKKKKKIEHTFEQELKEINMKIMEMNKKKCEIIKKKDIELIKMMREKEIYEEKIYYLQKKLSVPITVPIPKEERPKEISLNNSPKQLPMLKSFTNNNRFATIKDNEVEKRKQIDKCKTQAILEQKDDASRTEKKNKMNEMYTAKLKSIAKAKEEAKKVGERAKEEQMNKAIASAKHKAIAKAKEQAKKIGQRFYEDKKNKSINLAKLKSIAKAETDALKVGERAEKEKRSKSINSAKFRSIAKAEAAALKVGERAEKDKNSKSINSAKFRSIAKAKSFALKVGHRSLEDKRKKAIAYAKYKAVAKAKALALQVGQRAEKDKNKSINSAKFRSIAKAKSFALKVGHRSLEDKRKKAIAYAKYKAVAKAKALALQVGQRAEKAMKNEEEKSPINTVPVFKKVNEILSNTIGKVKEIAKDIIKNKKEEEPKKEEIQDEKEKLKKEEEAKKLKEKEKKEQIDKIMKITKETVNEINSLTKMVIEQSNQFIEQINNPEKKLNISSDDIILKSTKKEATNKKAIHFRIVCDGCKTEPIRGNRYKCKTCPDYDYCETCYEKLKESHGHEFRLIEKPKNTKRIGHQNTKYCQRGIVHKNVRCEECGLDPMVGWRYMCTICDDYNLCENCEQGNAIKHGHPFIKVTYPSLMNSFNNCYLKMNYYQPNNTK